MLLKLGKSLVTFFAVLLLAFSSVMIASSPANAVKLPELSETIYKEALDVGSTHEVSASLIGNIMQESGMRPDVVNPIGAGGLFQMYRGRMVAMKKYATSQGKRWQDPKLQVDYALKVEPKAGNQFMLPSSYSLDSVCATVKGKHKVDCAKAKELSKGLNMEKYLKITDIGVATILWSAMWERPGLGEMSMDKRLTYAHQAYKEFSGKTASSGGEGDDSKEESSSEKKPSITNSSKMLTDEYQLEGMGEKEKWSGAEDVVDASREDLSVAEQYRLSQVDGSMLSAKETTPEMLAVGVSVVGFVLLLWSVLMFAAVMFDKSNTLFDFGAVKTLSFGQMEYVHDKEGRSRTRLGMGKILSRIGVGFTIGLFLVSGVFFGWIEYILSLIQNANS